MTCINGRFNSNVILFLSKLCLCVIVCREGMGIHDLLRIKIKLFKQKIAGIQTVDLSIQDVALKTA